MREVDLTRDRVAFVDDVDHADVVQFKWYAHRVRDTDLWYAYRAVGPRGGQVTVSMHGYLTGFSKTDHIDGDGLNNQRINMREATHAENMRNVGLSRGNTSGFKGVVWHKQAQRWYAQISVDSRSRALGLHDTPEDAALAYDRAAVEFHGEFAKTNKILGLLK